MEKCPTLREWANEQALVYLGVRALLDAADGVYHRAAALDDRLRLGEQITQQEIETFVQKEAEFLMSIGAAEICTKDSVKVLIKESGYEAVVGCLKAYEYEGRREEQAAAEAATR